MMASSTNRRKLHIDLETFSSVNIKEVGAYAYAASKDFEILLIAYKFDEDSEVKQIDLANVNPDKVPEEFIEALLNNDIIKIAHNATFERVCLSRYLRDLCYIDGFLDPNGWTCTANRASELGIPRSLADVGRELGLAQEEAKMAAAGKALIRYFCVPCKPTKVNGGRTRNYPWHDIEKWETFKKYNRQDVVAESTIEDKENEYPASTENEHRVFVIDQLINDTGVAVDMDFVDIILEHSAKRTAKLVSRAQEITKLDNPNSLEQVKGWLARKGMPVESLSADSLDTLIDKASDPEIKEFLSIRKELGKTSVSKYEAMKRAAIYDEKTQTYRVHGMLQYYGAVRTGRWAGRIVQLQNLPKNKYEDLDVARDMVMAKRFDYIELCYGNVMDVLSQLIRTAFIPAKGKTFVVADYNAIEARVIAWFANEKWKIEMFERGGKVYEETASRMFGIPVSEIKHDSPERAKGKVAELAGGYGGGLGAYKRMGADNYGWSDEEINKLVKQWRQANSEIVALWDTINEAALKALKTPGIVAPVLEDPNSVSLRTHCSYNYQVVER